VRRAAEWLARAAGAALTAALTGLEALLAWGWLRGTRYVMTYGKLENPYAAEDAELAGLCALILLPLWLAALAWAVYETVLWWKKRAGARMER
jgi:hypothetical protein